VKAIKTATTTAMTAASLIHRDCKARGGFTRSSRADAIEHRRRIHAPGDAKRVTERVILRFTDAAMARQHNPAPNHRLKSV
jgi:hypothetical protein